MNAFCSRLDLHVQCSCLALPTKTCFEELNCLSLINYRTGISFLFQMPVQSCHHSFWDCQTRSRCLLFFVMKSLHRSGLLRLAGLQLSIWSEIPSSFLHFFPTPTQCMVLFTNSVFIFGVFYFIFLSLSLCRAGRREPRQWGWNFLSWHNWNRLCMLAIFLFLNFQASALISYYCRCMVITNRHQLMRRKLQWLKLICYFLWLISG